MFVDKVKSDPVKSRAWSWLGSSVLLTQFLKVSKTSGAVIRDLGLGIKGMGDGKLRF